MLLLHVCDQLGKEAGISYEKVADGGEKCPILVNTDMTNNTKAQDDPPDFAEPRVLLSNV